MKKVNLSDLKVGDKAFSAAIGECRVTYFFESIIQCDGTHEYNMDGTWFDYDDNPTLFHSEQEFREYWGLQRDTNVPLTKREQFAMAAMQGILANNRAPEFDYKHVTSAAIRFADYLAYNLEEIDPEIL
jgi:hypothetical protein